LELEGEFRAYRFPNRRHQATRLLRAMSVHFLLVLVVSTATGCGTTRMSDTLRTGTEQVLLSSAIDRAINDMDFSSLEGKDVYFDPQYLKGVSDEGYIVSSIRQKLLAAGIHLKGSRDEATYIVEARAGAVGTNRQDVLLGVPQVNLPSTAMASGVPSVIPEIPLAKSTQQKGVAKLAVFAYNQVTGLAVWQSGTIPITADAKDTWLLGMGPFQRGSIYNRASFAGERVMLPGGRDHSMDDRPPAPGLSVTASASFANNLDIEPPRPPESFTKRAKSQTATPASFTPAVPPSQPQPGRIPSLLPPTTTTPSASTGFSSSMYGTPSSSDAKSTSGGNAAAAGLMILGNGSRE
jgi:hypothetical protein